MFRLMQADNMIKSGALAEPDFRHVETWIFDLDNTLYTADSELMRQHEERICLFVQRTFALPREPAFALQKRYLNAYGTTLRGLMQNHGVDPDLYIRFVNDVDISSIGPDPELAEALARLPGRRLVFTNNCGRFAERVLDNLGIAHLVDDICDIRALSFVPKPDERAYDAAIARGGFAAPAAAMFEDTEKNLAPAHARGMTTVWLAPDRREAPDHVHHRTGDLCAFLQSIRI